MERDMDEIVSMSAGVDTSLPVFVSAPRVDASVAGDGRGVPAPQGGEFDARVGRRFRLGGEGRDAARGLHPLLFRVEAEGIVRVPAPGVQRAAPRDDGGVAAAGEDGLGGVRGVATGDAVTVGEGERGGGRDGPVERTLAGSDGGEVEAELTVLAAAPLRVGERGSRARQGGGWGQRTGRKGTRDERLVPTREEDAPRTGSRRRGLLRRRRVSRDSREACRPRSGVSASSRCRSLWRVQGDFRAKTTTTRTRQRVEVPMSNEKNGTCRLKRHTDQMRSTAVSWELFFEAFRGDFSIQLAALGVDSAARLRV